MASPTRLGGARQEAGTALLFNADQAGLPSRAVTLRAVT